MFGTNNNRILVFIIIIIGTTAHSEPRPPFEASTSCPCSLQHSSNFSPPASWILVLEVYIYVMILQFINKLEFAVKNSII
jgi:hypothetical protein